MAGYMSDVSELQKMKVPELKKILKEKGLSVVGNKADLILRLQGKEDTSLDQLESSREEADDILEDELNDEDDNPDTSDLTEGDSLLLPTTAKLVAMQKVQSASSKPTTTAAVPVKPKEKEITTIKPPVSTSTLVAQKLDQRLKRFGAVSEDVKKMARSKRFSGDEVKNGTAPAGAVSGPVKSPSGGAAVISQSALLLEEKQRLEKRKERFGVTSPGTTSTVGPPTASTSIAINKTDAVDALKKRAERFGQSSSPSVTKVNAQDKVLERKRRFGTVLAPSTVSISKTDSLQEKKSKRAERFGVVTSA